MTGNRLPAVKLKLTSDANIPPSEFKIYNDLFVSELNRITIASLTGETMTLAQYLREAMTLICYSEVVHQLGSPNTAKVMAAFEGYQRRTFTQPILELMQLLYRFSALMSDLPVSVLEYDFNPVFAFGGNSETNHITIRLIKSQAISIKLDNSLPVYIQRHALRRLSERTGISPGLIHQSVVDCFRNKEQISDLTQGGNSLVDFKIYDQKLGYLVYRVHEEMIVIRTFFFSHK